MHIENEYAPVRGPGIYRTVTDKKTMMDIIVSNPVQQGALRTIDYSGRVSAPVKTEFTYYIVGGSSGRPTFISELVDRNPATVRL